MQFTVYRYREKMKITLILYRFQNNNKKRKKTQNYREMFQMNFPSDIYVA